MKNIKEVKISSKGDRDLIAKGRYQVDRNKEKISELKDGREKEITIARNKYNLSLVRTEEFFKRDLVEVERLRREAQEKRKLSIADAKVVLKVALDRIEKKY
jgi:rRNA maturation endonuclease Nob1